MQPFIYYVLGFIGNARQLISTCQIIFFLTSKILFLKISLFQNFVSFLFDFKKKKFSRKFFTAHVLFTGTVYRYYSSHCSPYCSPKLQYNLFIAIHFQQCLPAMYCNTIHLPLQYTSSLLQYTFISLAIQSHPLHTQVAIQSVYCNTIFFQPLHTLAIQFFPIAIHLPSLLASLIAIQFPVLQYNFPAQQA